MRVVGSNVFFLKCSNYFPGSNTISQIHTTELVERRLEKCKGERQTYVISESGEKRPQQRLKLVTEDYYVCGARHYLTLGQDEASG